MKRKSIHFCIFLVALIFSLGANAQGYAKLSKAEKLALKLSARVYVDLNKVPSRELDTLLVIGTPLIVSLSADTKANLQFINAYRKYQKHLYIISKNLPDSYITDVILTTNIVPIVIKTIKIPSSGAYTLKEEVSDHLEFVKILLDAHTEATDSVLTDFWETSGEIPNFIYADTCSLVAVSKIVSRINKTPKVYGELKADGKLLSNVVFKNKNNARASGFFSFPIKDSINLPILIPYKAGYHFSPDILYTTPQNQNNLKVFEGFQFEPEDDLSDHFVFNSKIGNIVRDNAKEIISNGVLTQKDAEHGNVGFFSNRAYIDAGIKSREALQSSFTISSWVKPTTRDFDNSILGKGDNFVLKIHDGFLTFTMAGIKDYISKSSPVPINTWTHITLVHSKVNNELLFYINGKQTDRIKLISDYVISNYNILIGSNLWEEFFVGYLADIKIWDRELNDNEVKALYSSKSVSENKLAELLLFFMAVIGIGFLIFWLQKRRKLQKGKNRSVASSFFGKETNYKEKSIGIDFKEQILCFGRLRIINNSGEDIAKKLSPKLKQIFVIILLNSQENKRGITTKKLTELLWPGMSVQSAKNTRGTNIQNLRLILSTCSEVRLVFKEKYWFLEVTEDCYCDYAISKNYLDFLSQEEPTLNDLEDYVPKLLQILKEGRLLTNMEDIWFDPFMEKFSNQVIERLTSLTPKFDIQKHQDVLYSIAKVIYLYDDLNEQALCLKVKILIQQGKLSMARTVYDNFSKLYEKLYKEPYTVSFEKLLV